MTLRRLERDLAQVVVARVLVVEREAGGGQGLVVVAIAEVEPHLVAQDRATDVERLVVEVEDLGSAVDALFLEVRVEVVALQAVVLVVGRTLPWNWFPPDLVITLTKAPPTLPSSAGRPPVTTCTSWPTRTRCPAARCGRPGWCWGRRRTRPRCWWRRRPSTDQVPASPPPVRLGDCDTASW